MELMSGYKQTEVGVIPEDWETKPLGNFITLQRGHDLTDRQRKRGTVPVMGSAGQNGFHDTALAEGPGVVIGRSGASFGQAHYCEEDYWPHNTALYVTDFRDSDRLFVFYFLKYFDFSRHNSGGAQQSLNRNFIYPIKIAVPPVHEQRAIAVALSDIDVLIASLDRLIMKKRDIKQATMQDLLTGKRRLSGFSAEWEARPLGTLTTTVASGKSKVVSEYGAYSVHGSTGVIGFSNLADYEGDALLVARVGANAGKLNYVTGKYGVTDNTIIVKFGSNCHLSFYYSQLECKHLNNLVFGSGQPLITGTQLKSIMLNVPDLPEQIAIATILSDMDADIATMEQKLDKTQQLKQGMMQELLTGRIRLV